MDIITEKALTEAKNKMTLIKEARQTLTREVERLMCHSENDGLSWIGTTTDLMEALYCAYEEQTIMGDNGLPLCFKELVKRCCRVLHVKVPRNPYNMANKGKMRKGIKKQSLLSRTTHMSTHMSTHIDYCKTKK